MATFQMNKKTWEEISNDVNSAPNHVCMLRQEYENPRLTYWVLKSMTGTKNNSSNGQTRKAHTLRVTGKETPPVHY